MSEIISDTDKTDPSFFKAQGLTENDLRIVIRKAMIAETITKRALTKEAVIRKAMIEKASKVGTLNPRVERCYDKLVGH